MCTSRPSGIIDCENVISKSFYEKEVRTEPEADEANQSRCTYSTSTALGMKLRLAESF